MANLSNLTSQKHCKPSFIPVGKVCNLLPYRNHELIHSSNIFITMNEAFEPHIFIKGVIRHGKIIH